MSVSLIIITHYDIGQQMVKMVNETLGQSVLSISTMSVYPEQSMEQLIGRVVLKTQEVDQGDGVIIITDLYGATPGNIACRLMDIPTIKVITGLNLPMLFKAQNYADLPINELAEKILKGGREGILLCNQDICQTN
ncbi:MAG: PTS sugar transporter subunit IIA [Chromatiales bacterium]|nr:PTS sugar transporter subunit IIA [Chromatiales bacterium]